MTLPLNNIIQKAKLEGHSSEYISDISGYADNLISKKLPVIFSTTHLAKLIGIPPLQLAFIINNRPFNYKSYKLRKKHGGFRWINSPNKDLKYIQGWIKIHVLDIVESHEAACGFNKGSSIIKNATPHQKKDLILNIDLYRFFDSITEERVCGLFKWLGYLPNLAYDMAKLLCYQPSDKYFEEMEKEGVFSKTYLLNKRAILSQGSPASPVVSNILTYNLDIRLFNLAAKLTVNYSRYADDITFSGDRNTMVSLSTIKTIISEEGFYINKEKIKYLPKNRRQNVTGVVVNDGVRVNSAYKKKVFSELFFSEKFGIKNHLEFLKDKNQEEIKSNYKDHLLGKIYFIHSVEPDTGKKMLEQFDQIKWEI